MHTAETASSSTQNTHSHFAIRRFSAVTKTRLRLAHIAGTLLYVLKNYCRLLEYHIATNKLPYYDGNDVKCQLPLIMN